MVAKHHPFSVRSSDIGRLVNKFDFSKMNVRDSSREDYLYVNLAPAYGNLTQQSIKTMDKQLLVMIGVTIRKLRSIPPKKRTWANVVASMNQNCAFKPRGPPLEKNDKYKNGRNHFMKVDGSPDPFIVKEVDSWLDRLLNDRDVRQSLKFDIDVLGRIVAQSGATIRDVQSTIHKIEQHEKTIVDIGVLRYPDIQHPYFKLYHLRLRAYSNSDRILAWQCDKNGIDGSEFIPTLRTIPVNWLINRKVSGKQEYEPRPEILAGAERETVRSAIRELNDLFR